MLTLEKFIASITRQQYRKWGMYDWDNGILPTRTLFLTYKQAQVYNSLFTQRTNKIEKIKDWSDGAFRLSKDGRGVASLLHKSGLSFGWANMIDEKSFSIANLRTKKVIWISNSLQPYYKLTVKNFSKSTPYLKSR